MERYFAYSEVFEVSSVRFLQRGLIAYNAECCNSYGNSVRTSVCLSGRRSVTRWYLIQTNEDRITESSL